MFDPKFISYIDSEAFKIIELVTSYETEGNKSKTKIVSGSITEKPFIDWSEKIIEGPIVEKQQSINGDILKITKTNNSVCHELNTYACAHLKKLSQSIFKNGNINNKVDYDFISSKLLDWIFDTVQNKKANSNFMDYLLDEITNSIEKLKISFKVLHLEIEHTFRLGNIEFNYFTKEFLDKLDTNDTDLKQNDTSLNNKYQGQVFVSCIVEAEPMRAEKIAFDKCSLAVDILKILSLTVQFPIHRIIFDIDSRIRFNPDHHETILQNLNIENDFRINLVSSRNGQLPCIVNNSELVRMHKLGFTIFSQYINTSNNSELNKIIHNSIHNFANALSNNDLHKRVVDLFSVLESLLLKDDNQPISDSISTYLSKLVTNEFLERKNIILITRELYKIRSQMIHHFKRTEINLDHLSVFQMSILFLLKKMIEKSKIHDTKQSLFKEIDNEIIKAYNS